jgi:hypothetical protein
MVIVTHAFAAEQTWTGATSDKMCGADYKKWRATNRVTTARWRAPRAARRKASSQTASCNS